MKVMLNSFDGAIPFRQGLPISNRYCSVNKKNESPIRSETRWLGFSIITAVKPNQLRVVLAGAAAFDVRVGDAFDLDWVPLVG